MIEADYQWIFTHGSDSGMMCTSDRFRTRTERAEYWRCVVNGSTDRITMIEETDTTSMREVLRMDDTTSDRVLVMNVNTSTRTIHTTSCRHYIARRDNVDKYGLSIWSSVMAPDSMRRMHNMMTTTHCDTCKSYRVMIGR